MSEELKACPFCGKEKPRLWQSGGYWKIKCVDGCSISIIGYWKKEGAIAAWNRRLGESDAETTDQLTSGMYLQTCQLVNKQMSETIDKLRKQIDENDQLFKLQHKRVREADKRFQVANQVDYFPDLGQLVQWLMIQADKANTRIAELEAEADTADACAIAQDGRIAELEAAQRWITVDERMPVCDLDISSVNTIVWSGDVLCLDKDGAISIGYAYMPRGKPELCRFTDEYIEENNLPPKNVTHWMPLPAVPSKESK